MILRIILFFSSVIWVSTSTGFPVNPTQIYPIYQQNGYAHPVVNQPNNFTPYSQSTMAQNESPPMNLSPSNVRQILLNNIMSSPSVQSILGSNLGGYGSNLLDFNNNPIDQNPVKNYFESPPVFQYLNDQPIDVNKESKADIGPEKHKKRERKSRKKQESEKNENKASKNAKRKDKNIQTVENTTENSKKSRKRSRKKNADVTSQNETKNDETESNTERKTKKRKNKDNEQSKSDSTDKENKADKSKSGRRRKKRPKSNKDSENVPLEQDSTQNMGPNEIKEGINVVNFNEGIVEENRVPRNPIPEGNDLLKAIPLSESTGANFMKTLSQFDNNPYMSNFFANYENIYQSMLASGVGRDEKREKIKTARKKRTRKHDKRRTTQNKNRNSTEAANIQAFSNTPKTNPKTNVVTTERTIIIKEKTHANADSIPNLKDLQSLDKISEVKEQILKEDGYYEKTQLNSNLNVLDAGYDNSGYIDDYYPIFNDNAAYNANNKEVYVKHLGDTKYYYAIDKDNTDAINRRRFEHYQLPERVVKDYEINKQYEDTEKESMKNLKTENKEAKEEIKFRSPPHLELPDFQTRQINKSEINPEPIYNFEESNHVHRFVGDKSRTENKSHNKQESNGKLKEDHKDIETVFATSKVVKYGSPMSSEHNDEVGFDKSIPPEETDLNDGSVAYVFAKSLDYPETYW